jgi:hypothetical protein
MQLWVLLPYFVGIVAVVGFVALLRWGMDREGRRSPLAGKQTHLPGEHCRQQIDKEDQGIFEGFAMALIAPLAVAAVWAGKWVDWSAVSFGANELFLSLMLVGMLAYAFRKIARHARSRRQWSRGLRAELATAQHLQALMAEGCLVFNDLPCDGFNIDHVVIGPRAVFAVETKSRYKPSEKGKDSARVQYDGKRLRFPSHQETKPIEQARAQARWLATHLAGAAGEPVRVVPVVALPGWYVELSKEGSRADVLVANPKNVRFMTSANFGEPMPENLRRRIAHGLTQRYPEFD